MCSSRGTGEPSSTAEISTAVTISHAEPLAGGERLGDAADRVVVGQREQLDAGVGGAGDDLLGGQRAVGVRGVRLQVEARWHARSVCDRLRASRARARERWASRRGEPLDVARDRVAQRADGGVVAAGRRRACAAARARVRWRAAPRTRARSRSRACGRRSTAPRGRRARRRAAPRGSLRGARGREHGDHLRGQPHLLGCARAAAARCREMLAILGTAIRHLAGAMRHRTRPCFGGFEKWSSPAGCFDLGGVAALGSEPLLHASPGAVRWTRAPRRARQGRSRSRSSGADEVGRGPPRSKER